MIKLQWEIDRLEFLINDLTEKQLNSFESQFDKSISNRDFKPSEDLSKRIEKLEQKLKTLKKDNND